MLDFVTLYINNIIINNNYNIFDKILLKQNKNKTQQALRVRRTEPPGERKH